MTTRLSRRRFLSHVGALATGATATGALAACGAKSPPRRTERVTLLYQFFDTRPLPDVALVQDAMNQRIRSLGKSFKVQLDPLDETTFKTRIPLAFAAGSAGDVVFTAPWLNNYYTNASLGDYLALDELLPRYASGLWKSLATDTWNAARVNGKIRGAINQQLWPASYGYVARQDIAEKYGLKPDRITKYDDLTPYFREIKAGEPSTTVWLTDNTGHGALANFTWDALGYGLAVNPDDANLKVFNTIATDEYRQKCELVRQWHLAGYTAINPPPATDATAAWLNGSIAFQGNQANGNVVSPFPTVEKSLQEPLLTTGAVTATLSAVNSRTKYPKEAVEFLELLNTDKKIYNLICFGIEGKDYVVTDKALGVVGFPDGVTAANDKYNPDTDWQFGNQFNAYYRTEAAAKSRTWDVQKRMNEEAKRSKALGFAPQIDSVQTEVATVSAVMAQYGTSIALGLVDTTSGIDTYLQQLKAAGIDKIQQTLQSQIDKWAGRK